MFQKISDTISMALKRVLSSFLSCFCCLIREKKLRKRLEKTKIELFNLNNINKQRVLISLILKFKKFFFFLFNVVKRLLSICPVISNWIDFFGCCCFYSCIHLKNYKEIMKESDNKKYIKYWYHEIYAVNKILFNYKNCLFY